MGTESGSPHLSYAHVVGILSETGFLLVVRLRRQRVKPWACLSFIPDDGLDSSYKEVFWAVFEFIGPDFGIAIVVGELAILDHEKVYHETSRW